MELRTVSKPSQTCWCLIKAFESGEGPRRSELGTWLGVSIGESVRALLEALDIQQRTVEQN